MDLRLQPDARILINHLVENTFRNLINNACKFRDNAKRDELIYQDIRSTIKYMNINFVDLSVPQQSNQQLGDQIINLNTFISRQLEELNQVVKKPQLPVRWIYINNRVPCIQANLCIQSSLYLNSQVSKQNGKKFHIIKDNPASLLYQEESKLMNLTINQMEKFKDRQSITNFAPSLFPFLINYILNDNMSPAKVFYLIQVLNTVNIQKSIEFHLHQIISYLINYEGNGCWQVGLQLSRLITKFQNKYPLLNQTLVSHRESNYYFKIKQLAYHVYTGKPIQINLQNFRQDLQRKQALAVQLRQYIKMCHRRITKTEYFQYLEEGLVGIISDQYLMTVL